jgi:hypothetical protein
MRILLLCIVLIAAVVQASTVEPRVVMATRTNSPKIDGVLEAEWFRAGVADSFVQTQPDDGKPAHLPTRVYVLYDDDAIYIGALCLDTAPDSIHGPLLRRDNERNSDLIDIYLDTFHDHRNAYWWTLTAAGVQSEGTVANENSYDNALDMIWQSAVGRTDSGWVAEVKLPFSSFRHGGARPDGWGFNVSRYVERRDERSYWQPVNRDRSFRVSEMGVLSGLAGLHSAEHLEVLPHAVGRWDAAPSAQAADGSQTPGGKWMSNNQWENLGVDVKVVPRASWTADLTYQPDFAQVDVDDEVINLDPYPILVTEKRPFFLESKEIYDNAPITLLYTRRINDPDYGARFNYSQGSLRGNLLAAQDRTLSDDQRTVAAGRGLWNIGTLHSIGATGTFVNSDILRAAAGAVDGRYRWGQENFISGTVSAVDREFPGAEHVRPYSGIFRTFVGWKQWLKTSYRYLYRGTDYDINDLGYVTYSNVMQNQFDYWGNVYPEKGMLQRIGWDLNTFENRMTNGKYGQGEISTDVFVATRSNHYIGIGSSVGRYARRVYDWENNAGEFRDNFGTFDPDVHWGNDRFAWYDSDSRLPVEFHTNVHYGLYREGKRWSSSNYVLWKPRGNFDASLGIDWFEAWDVGDINNYLRTDFRVYRLRARYSPTLNVSLRGTVQMEGSTIPGDPSTVNTNLLLAWNWHPGSWFYVVYDEGGRVAQPLAYAAPGARTLRTKFTYFFTVS